MRNIAITLLTAIIASVIFGVTGCDKGTEVDFAESFKYVKSVTPINSPQNTSMDLQDGNQESFFTVKLNGGAAMEAWCVEWNERANKETQKGVNLYSTRGKEQWKKLNYFMSIKDELKANDPDLTYREIQVVIWSLIDNPTFDVDKIDEYENLSTRIYKDGTPLFEVKKVKNILSNIENHFSSAQNKIPAYNHWVTLIENDGQTIMIGNETAYAVKTLVNGNNTVNGNYSSCFSEEIIPGVSFANWGWTNGTITEPSGELTYKIYAGAGQCDLNKGRLVGTLTAEYKDGTLVVTYQMTESSNITEQFYTMTETHLYVGSEPYPKNNGGKYTVAPGQYGYKNVHDDITEYTYEVDGLSGDIYFIAHAVVNGFPI